MKTSKEMLKKIITLLKPKHAKLQDTKYKKKYRKNMCWEKKAMSWWGRWFFWFGGYDETKQYKISNKSKTTVFLEFRFAKAQLDTQAKARMLFEFPRIAWQLTWQQAEAEFVLCRQRQGVPGRGFLKDPGGVRTRVLFTNPEGGGCATGCLPIRGSYIKPVRKKLVEEKFGDFSQKGQKKLPNLWKEIKTYHLTFGRKSVWKKTGWFSDLEKKGLCWEESEKIGRNP